MLAAIDIGTNTVRMLLGEVVKDRIRSSRYLQIISRLGGGMTKQEGLTPEAMERTLSALKHYAEVLNTDSPVALKVVATAALRRAANAAEFVRQVGDQTGLSIDIISGDEEARLTACGVLSVLDPVPVRSLLFDIGGGSTEFILLEGHQIRFQKSYSLGVVGLAEQASPDWPSIIAGTIQTLINDLSHHDPICLPSLELVGTAGTLTTLAALALGMQVYDRTRVNNHVLERDWLQQTWFRLVGLSPQLREQLPGIEQGRGDLILPGLAIVLALHAAFKSDRVIVSDAGLLEGLLLSIGHCS